MAALPTFSSPPPLPPLRGRGTGAPFDAASRTTGIAVAFVIHAVLLAALWSYEPARTALLTHAPIVVELLTPPRVEPPPPPPPARPRPVAKPQPAPHPTPPPIVAAPQDTPGTWTVAPPPPEPPAPPPVETPTVIAAPVAPPAPPAPVAVVPPRFDADYLRNPAPEYPPLSRRRGEQGRVFLRVLVSPEGEARTVEIRTSSGFETLDRTAVETVRRWRFVPARLGTTPVEAWVIVPLSFSLTR